MSTPTPSSDAPSGSKVHHFVTGVGMLGRGIGIYLRSPKLLLLGLVPTVISAVLFIAAFGSLIYFGDDIGAAVTPFADDWSDSARNAMRLIASIAVLAIGAVVGVLVFTAITLVIGDPFYEKISELVERRFGGVPGEIHLPWWRSMRRSVVDSLRLVARSVLVGIPLFLAGFLPVVGQTAVPVLGVLIGGWFLAVELVGVPFARRGLRLTDRRRQLKANRPLALGFGAATFLCFLVPFGAVLIMPAAVIGATLMSRRVLNQPTRTSGA